MSEEDFCTLREIDVSYFRAAGDPLKWPSYLLDQAIHTGRKLPGLRARAGVFLMRRAARLLRAE